jgi:predicted ATP-grasp superfamily ATP-dependent carboligase
VRHSGYTVVITDAEQRAALALVRSLGRAGYRCVVVGAAPRALAAASRYAAREVIAPDPLREPESYAEVVSRIVHEEEAAVLLPVTEAAMLALLPTRPSISPTIIPWPDLVSFRRICDKQLLLSTASEIGVAVPAQHVVWSAAEALAIADDALRFPLVLKPARSIAEHNDARYKLTVMHARDSEELRSRVRALPAAAFPLLLQERIVGPGTGIFLLLWDELIATFAHRRLREKPPAGGISVYSESIAVDPDLLACSVRLLERFAWRGVAMVEYKRDAKTGKPYLMEVNGRFWGSLQLAITAGVDFPRLLVECALGKRVDTAPPYAVGIRNRWWWGEVDHLLTRMRRSPAELALAGDVPSVGRAAIDFLISPLRRADRDEVFRISDPYPFLRETASWLRQV